MKPEKSMEEKINEAIKDVQNALLEKIQANKAVVNAQLKQRKAHFTATKAKERLVAIEREFME